MSRLSYHYSVRPKTTHSLTISSPQRDNYQSLQTCYPCKKESLKYRPSFIATTEAEQYLKSTVKCNLSKFILTKIKHMSSRNQSKITPFTIDNPEIPDMRKSSIRKGVEKRVVAQPFVLNYKQKLQRMIQKMHENQQKYKELCTRINGKIQRSLQKRGQNISIQKTDTIGYHRRYKSTSLQQSK